MPLERMPTADDYDQPMNTLNGKIMFNGLILLANGGFRDADDEEDRVEDDESEVNTGAQIAFVEEFKHLYAKNPSVIAGANHLAQVRANQFFPAHYAFDHPEERVKYVTTIYNGIIGGILTASEVHGPDFRMDIALRHGLQLDVDEDASEIVQDQNRAIGLISYGDQGLYLIGERNRRRIKRWAPELTEGRKNARVEKGVLMGFGVAVMSAWNLQAAILKSRQEADSGR